MAVFQFQAACCQRRKLPINKRMLSEEKIFMTVENAPGISDGSPPTVRHPGDKPKSKAGNPMLWLQAAVFLLGAGLLFYLIYKIGFQTLIETVSKIGWGFLIVVSLNGTRHLIRAWCIYLTIPPRHRTFKFRSALAARLGGEAVSVVTFTGPFLGEATKAALLKKDVPISQGGAAVVVDNILYYISVIIMILSGVGVMFYFYSSANSIRYVLLVIAAFGILSFAGMILLVRFQVKPAGFLIRRLSRLNLVPQFILKRLNGINEIEINVYDFYQNRRRKFFSLFGLNVAAHSLSVLEVFLALKMLGFASNLTVSFIIESLTKVINFTFSFVPGAIGVYEGGSGIILHALGYATATGVALALVRRGAILFWTTIGLAILLWRTVTRGTQRLVKRPS